MKDVKCRLLKFFCFLVALSMMGLVPLNDVYATQSCVITIDTSNVLGDISRMLYGTNHRYLDNGVGMWDVANNQAYPGFTTVYDDIGVTELRYPGGTVANTFDWKRSIGSARLQCVHGKDWTPEETYFGLDEATRYAESHNGAKMVYMYGMGIGSAADAADLVEYLNTPNDGSNPNGGTDWAAQRASNGHPEPYNIKSFEIGNEMYLTPQRYWLDGSTLTGKTNYEDKYVLGDTVRFTDQPVGLYADWRNSAANSGGTANQVKYAKYPPVNQDTQTVKVNGAAWTKVSSLSSSGPNDTHYTLDGATGKITFGDGVHGKIPPSGNQITITYDSTHDGFNAYVSAMKAVDPTIKIFSCLHSNHVIDQIGTSVNYDGVVMHPYTGVDGGATTIDDYHDYIMIQAYPRRTEVENTLSYMRGKFTGSRADSMMANISEYGILKSSPPTGMEYYLMSLGGSIYVAKSLMNWVNIAQVNANKHCTIDLDEGSGLGAGENAIIAQYPDFVKSATARVFKIFTKMFGPVRINTSITGNPTRTIFNGSTLTYLQGVSSKDYNNVYLIIANSDRTTNVATTIQLQNCTTSGTATVWTLNSANFTDYNTPSNPDNVMITISTIPALNTFDYTFPAHSVVAIKIPATFTSGSVAGYWKFDESSGSTAYDSSGNIKNGTLMNGAAWYKSGEWGGCLSLDGIDDYVSLPNIVNPANTDFTAAAWVKLDSAYGGNQMILQQEGTTGRGWLYRNTTDGKLYTYLGNTALTSVNTLDLGKWYHVAVVRSGSNVKLFLNGVLESSAIRTVESATGNMRVGSHKSPNTTNEEWKGLMDQLKIYNYALNDSNVLNLYNSER